MNSASFVLCLILGIVVTLTVEQSTENELDNALQKDFRNFFESGHVGKTLKKAANDFGHIFRDSAKEESWKEPKISLFCTTCATGVNEILRLHDPELVISRSILLCEELGFGTPYVCEGLINSNAEEVIYIVSNTPDETGNDICGVIFVGFGCKSRNPDRVWEVTLPDTPKPPIDNTPYPQDSVPTLKILHLADTHYDPEYAPGSPIECDEVYLCCRENGVPPIDANNAAGFWGSYGACDIPKWTLGAMYDHISKTHPDIDFIIWTGDLIPHSVWKTSKDGNLAIINEMADLLYEHFPQTPVYPALGNHEGDPVNQFPQPYISDPKFDISWLYDELATIWGRWLPEEAVTSVSYSAYYAVQIRPGLKILSVNTNYCYGYNWWLIHDSTDIANELDLIAKELQKSEDIGEMVYIIGHIPPGHRDCSHTWSNQFNKIVARYESTISGLFYAHTHNDHFELFFDPQDKERVYKTGYIAQSQTTYSDLNPGYKIYTVEGDFEGSRYRVIDHENWILDIPMANILNETNFVRLYSAKDEYGLTDLSPESWYNLVIQMNEPNSTLFDTFYRNFVKAGTPLLVDGCDDDCKLKILCSTLISDNSDHSKCDLLY